MFLTQLNPIPSLPALNERLCLTHREMLQMDPEVFERSINLIRFKTSRYNIIPAGLMLPTCFTNATAPATKDT
jgi:hypothetical protein